MNTIFEATKRDGTRQLLTDGFIRNIHRACRKVKTKSSRARKSLQMLAQFCYLKDYVRIDVIDYGVDAMRRTELICED